MTPARLAALLVEHGLDEADALSKQSLIARTLETFARRCGGSPSGLWWVPGRLEVFGKHTDYAGGRTLVAAVPRGLIVAARLRGDDDLRVLDGIKDEEIVVSERAGAATFTGWRHYPEVVARRLSANFPGMPAGADIVFASDLPRASGMSSSSALVVGIAAALVDVAGLRQTEAWTTSIRTPLDEAGYYACIENGLSFGSLRGDAGVGTHGGSEDHAAIVTARAGHVSAFSFVPMRLVAETLVPAAWRFVIAPSGIRAAKTGNARDRYNRLSHGTRLLLDIWNEAAPRPGASLAVAIESDGAAVERLRALITRARVPGWSPAGLLNRLDHFVREDARVPAAMEAFRAADRTAVGELAAQSQADAAMLLENQIPETQALATSARALGGFAACSFGAGFGGSVWALVDAADASAFAARWHRDAFVAVPGPARTALGPARSSQPRWPGPNKFCSFTV